jgi:type I restriction enzyme, specificity subunit
MKNIKKISNFVEFISGVNPTRVNKQLENGIIYYEQSDFNNDFNHLDVYEIEENPSDFGKQTLKEGDIVISNNQQKAVMIGKSNAGKVISLNFTKVEFKKQTLDKNYFLYLFNSNKSIQRQKEREKQGDVLQKLSTKALGELKIPVIPLEKQKKIGEAYSKTLKLQGELIRYSTLLEQFSTQILEKTLQGD